jgi:two-component system OmpR family sensor kinase
VRSWARFWPRSLGSRIYLSEAAAIAAAVLVLPLATVNLLDHTIDKQQQALLAEQADRIAGNLATSGRGVRVTLPEPWRTVYATAFDGRAYLVLDRQGNVLARSPGSAEIATAHIPRRPLPRPFRQHQVIGWSRPAALGGTALWVVVLQNEATAGAIIDDIARNFVWRDVALLTALLLLIPFASAIFINGLARGVRRAAAQAAAMGPDTPGLRIDQTGLPEEVARMASVTNDLVDRLENSLSEHRAFIANVAHELLTPLATFRLRLDALESSSNKAQLEQSVTRVSHVIAQLRDLAELELVHETSERFDLNEVTIATIEACASTIYDAHHSVELRGAAAPVWVMGRRLLIELAMRNLIDNAVRHTPAGTHIRIGVLPEGGFVVVDNGPGLAPEVYDKVRMRFWSTDQTHGKNNGFGLGLSIVDRICQVHGGQFSIGPSSDGGTRCHVQISL